MRRFSLGIVSLFIALLAGTAYALHFGNVLPLLNSMLVPMLTIVGLMMGVVGFFERDKKRIPALMGMIFNAAFLIWFAVLFIQELAEKT